jgi:hypothetical protein
MYVTIILDPGQIFTGNEKRKKMEVRWKERLNMKGKCKVKSLNIHLAEKYS